ncbi:MAG: alpha/beta hydrolase [Ruminococcaceae bacterium]|nr:alpha/beta hydrolase [Oscillospiraceae bacterium]
MIFEKKVIDIYKGLAYTRCDDNGTAYYFSEKDFEGLRKENYPFVSSMGHTLQGFIYSYENPIQGRLIVFDHGFFGGHRSYMREIEELCRHGYTVFAYDHTGCMESGGETPNGMVQSLHDLNDCLLTIKKDSRFENLDISVIGHSWGGFSVMNISALHPEISHVVVMSGFVSAEMIISSFFGGILKPYRKAIIELEKKSNPDFFPYDGIKTLSETNAKVLLIYSADDNLVRKQVHFDKLKNALSGKENIKFLLEENKGHNPNYTCDAVKYLGEFTAKQTALSKKKLLTTDEQKKKFVNSFDWKRMTEQDEKVWNEIFRCLDS